MMLLGLGEDNVILDDYGDPEDLPTWID